MTLHSAVNAVCQDGSNSPSR